MSRRTARWMAAGAGLLLCAVAPGIASEPLNDGERTIVNFAFATQLGSGVYSVADRTIQVYRIPLSYMVRPETPERCGFQITFPVTFGFYDFQTRDVFDTGLPHELNTLSLVPGLESRLQLGKGWLLKPFVEAGVAKDRSHDANAYIYS